MKLKSLKMQGFKSFPDSTVVEFHEGVTAVVGPNGCGKSNIADAVRWVLGEQRPTAIRGARMEEAIFQGTVSRRPVGRGSVTLVASNEDGTLPVPFEEVEIARTVYRDGGSEYQLNRAPCRLRDVVDMCRDTGLGTGGYSVIEVRMIDAILSGRAEERRALFEEAAGVGKYKDRRRTALRRLELSELDLQRVDSVVEEVRTKVRSLARQRGKAKRYKDLRERRLVVELAVARDSLAEFEERMARVDRELEAGRDEGAVAGARLASAESDLERLRLERVEAEKTRTEAAQRLDRVAAKLASAEKESAVAAVQIDAGRRRAAQIEEEAEALEAFRTRSAGELAGLRQEGARKKAALEAAGADLARRREVSDEAGRRLEAARAALGERETRHREMSRRLAQLQGDQESARVQAGELDRRIGQLSGDAESGAGALERLSEQKDLFSARSAEAERKAEDAAEAFDEARRRLAGVRERLARVRELEMELESRSTALAAEAAGLRKVAEAAGEAEALAEAARKSFPVSVLGVLADFVTVSGADAKIVDDALGPLGFALVIAGVADADAIVDWYCAEPERKAGLALLPADRAPRAAGPLPPGAEAGGAGAAWVEAVLGGLGVQAGTASRDDADGKPDDGRRVWTDALGALHVVPEHGAPGPIERAAHLKALEAEAQRVGRDLEETRDRRAQIESEQSDSETKADEVSEQLLKARDDARSARAESAAHSDERERLGRHQEETARRLEAARAARARAGERERAAAGKLAGLSEEEAVLGAALEDRRAELAAAETEWEKAREAQSEAAVGATRIESDCERIGERAADADAALLRTTDRLAELKAEAAELKAEAERLGAVAKEAEAALENLFGKRGEALAALSDKDRVLDEARKSESDLERQVREVRGAERQAAERRHQLEMERQDLANRTDRVAERIEAEWGRPLEALLAEAQPAEGAAEELREELAEIAGQLARMGAVNMLAVEEHAEESERLAFLVSQRDDLAAARDDLRAAVRDINAKATELFTNTFEAIRERFQRTFQHLFSGGEADVWLADPDDPLESPVEIHAAPRGKRTQRIDLLSGGERALTALSLLFGIYLVKPSPFCFLDEVDAPLDESNITRFVRLLHDFKADTQFVVITHNPRTIEAADWIYGVTMEEPGVSAIVGVQLGRRDAGEGAAA